MYGCLLIKVVNQKDKLTKKMLRRSKVVTDYKDYVVAIEASIKIGNHKTTIGPKYKSYIHCNNIGDNISIQSSDNFPMRTGDRNKVTLKFYNNQFIYPGCRYILREDGIKAYGIISKVILSSEIE